MAPLVPLALLALLVAAPDPARADRVAFEVAGGVSAHSGLLLTTELRGFVGGILRSDAPAGPLHALGYQLRLEFAPLLFVHAVDRWRSLMHAHYLTGIGLVGAQRRLFWSAGMGVAFAPFGVGPEVEGRVGYAIGRRPRLRWVIGLHARAGFAIAYHQIPTMAAGAFVGLFHF